MMKTSTPWMDTLLRQSPEEKQKLLNQLTQLTTEGKALRAARQHEKTTCDEYDEMRAELLK